MTDGEDNSIIDGRRIAAVTNNTDFLRNESVGIEGFLPGCLAGLRSHLFTMPGFHLRMLYAGVFVLVMTAVGCKLTSIAVPEVGSLLIFLGIFVVVLPPFVLYLKEKGKSHWTDAALTIFWALLFNTLLFYPVAVAARLGAIYPLQDLHLIQVDHSLNINVLSFEAWAATHWLGLVVNKSYPMLFPLMKISILLPVLTGRIKYAQDFLTANLIAFAIGLPMFALVPAIGPWYGFHLDARADEAACQAALLLLRSPGPYIFSPPAGVICFPSFHVVWAILCTQALWGFRWLRIPVGILSGMIIISTLTTGVHYFCDVLAGILVAAISILLPKWLNRSILKNRYERPVTPLHPTRT